MHNKPDLLRDSDRTWSRLKMSAQKFREFNFIFWTLANRSGDVIFEHEFVKMWALTTLLRWDDDLIAAFRLFLAGQCLQISPGDLSVAIDWLIWAIVWWAECMRFMTVILTLFISLSIVYVECANCARWHLKGVLLVTFFGEIKMINEDGKIVAQ